MSRLLLAKAARVCGWPPERWRDGWPDLLTARELAKLQGDPDVEAIMPPQGAGLLPERPRYAASRGGMFDPITGARGGYRLSDAPKVVPAYDAAIVRPLLAGVDLSPLLAAWLDARAPEQAPALAESQGKPHAHIQERAARLAAVLAEIEARAKELNHHFDRAQWPGTKAEFRAFLRWKDENLAYRLPADDGRLSDELRPHGVKFGRPGRDTTKGLNFYRALFPDYPA